MKNVLRATFARLLAGEHPREARNPDVLARFEQRHLSDNLARLFERALSLSVSPLRPDVQEPLLVSASNLSVSSYLTC